MGRKDSLDLELPGGAVYKAYRDYKAAEANRVKVSITELEIFSSYC